MSQWIQGQVEDITWWTQKLFTLKVRAAVKPFKAGQFTKLALQVGDKRIARAYSFVNAPHNPVHEFYVIEVEDGLLSPPLASLLPGDNVWIEQNPSGYFTLDEVPDSEQLWMLSTGTAIGPFLSMLRDEQLWQHYQQIVLVHGVRHNIDLSYQALLLELQQQKANFSYIPVVSREQPKVGVAGRITKVLNDGELEEYCGLICTPEKSQFMICGNPQMVKDTTLLLQERGFLRNRRAAPGHITVEQYW
ncbi:ferredoxin--NADP reductase [Pseudoalteromonas fenneropenaei]|uniref:ferredoxin--NADP(+) reductase n=1 Tax=Pseudoalteromonas fenneropenaei TaxID=1737459 RepID=A0ABV7CG73_9GAMM